MAEAFAVPADYYGLHAGFDGECCEEVAIALADCFSGCKGSRWSGGLHIVVEEIYHVVFDVVMEPGEDGTCFVGEGGERLG